MDLGEGLLDEQGFTLEMLGFFLFKRVAAVDLGSYRFCIVATTRL
jgi:hypothetical protein